MGQFKNLFIVEPNSELNESYRAAFEAHGVFVTGFSTLDELDQALEEVLPDAVIVDQAAIGEGRQMENFRRIRKDHPVLATYLTTTTDLRPEDAWGWAVNGVFYKPFRINQVVTQLMLDLVSKSSLRK